MSVVFAAPQFVQNQQPSCITFKININTFFRGRGAINLCFAGLDQQEAFPDNAHLLEITHSFHPLGTYSFQLDLVFFYNFPF